MSVIAARRLIHRLIRTQEFDWWSVASLAGCMVYGLRVRNQFDSNAHAAGATTWDFLLSFCSDPYLLLYGIFPLYLVHTARTVVEAGDTARISRSESGPRWLLWTISDTGDVTRFFVPWLLAGIVSSVGLPWKLGRITPQGRYISQVLESLGASRAPSLVLVLLQLLLLWMYLVALKSVCATVYYFEARVVSVAAAAVTIWVWMLATFVAGQRWRFVVTQLFLLSVAIHKTPLAIAPLLPLGVVAICLMAIHVCDAQYWSSRKIDWGRPVLLHAAASGCALIATIASRRDSMSNAWDPFLYAIYGVSSGSTQMVSYMLFTIVFLGYAYVTSFQLAEELGSFHPYVVIRNKSPNKWLLKYLFRNLSGSFIFLTTFLVGSLFLGTSLVGTLPDIWHGSPLPQISTETLLASYVVGGLLQICIYSQVVFLSTWWFPGALSGIIASGVLVTIGPLIGFAGPYMPVALNSTGLMMDGYSPVLLNILMAASVVLLLGASLVSVNHGVQPMTGEGAE